MGPHLSSKTVRSNRSSGMFKATSELGQGPNDTGWGGGSAREGMQSSLSDFTRPIDVDSIFSFIFSFYV